MFWSKLYVSIEVKQGTLRFLFLSHLLYGVYVKIFIMIRYISKSYTMTKNNAIDRQYRERGHLWYQLLLVMIIIIVIIIIERFVCL